MSWRPNLEDLTRDELVSLTQDCVAELARRCLRETEAEVDRRRAKDRPKDISW